MSVSATSVQNVLYVTFIISKEPAKTNEDKQIIHFPGAVSSTEIEPPTTEATGEEARVEAENGTDLETRDTLPGFGSAHMFMPIPNSGTVVAAHCNWQFRYNYVENRIPRQLTAIYEKDGYQSVFFRNYHRGHVCKPGRVLWK